MVVTLINCFLSWDAWYVREMGKLRQTTTLEVMYHLVTKSENDRAF